MAVRVTIEARDRQAAEVVARHLGSEAQTKSWRGLGVIRVVARDRAETAGIVAKVSGLLEKHRDLGWVRIRYGDESRVFRSNGFGRRTA
jgi:hypothetical protein